MSDQSILHAVHKELGATFTDFAGATMPLRYTSEIAEHHAVRTTAGIFDLSHMGEIEVTGVDAAAGLDAAVVSDMSAIAVGRAKYTMICDDRGGIIDDLVVYRVAQNRYLVVANASNRQIVLRELQERIPPAQGRVVDASRDWSLIAVQGPASAAIVSAATGRDLAALKYYAIAPAAISGHDILLARTGYTGEDGLEVYCRPDVAADVWRQLTSAGEPYSLTAAGLACRDSLRLEAGMPLYGRELSRDVTPFEAGLGRVVALRKRTRFIGQDALRARKVSGVDRRLVGLTSSSQRAPRAGYDVIAPVTGAVIGVITSGIPSPTLGHGIAMAYVPPAFVDPGTALEVDIRGRATPVTVVAIPFYRRPAND